MTDTTTDTGDATSRTEQPWYPTIDDIKRANERAGWHFFSPDTMRFFHSRISGTVISDGRRALFVTSEQREPGSTPRRYTIREAHRDGKVDTVGEFHTYPTLRAAQRAAADTLRQDLRRAMNDPTVSTDDIAAGNY